MKNNKEKIPIKLVIPWGGPSQCREHSAFKAFSLVNCPK